jgi:HPt (histidine-containing phosphotransfer) domain-containing protein
MTIDRDVIDITRINDLRDLFDADFATTLRSFLGNAQLYATAIGNALAQGDSAGIEHNAHKLKSSAAMFGAVLVSSISAEIELEVRDGDITRIQVLHKALMPALERAVRQLKTYTEEPESGAG